MAYPLAAGDIVEIQYRYRMQSQQCINTFHYQLNDPVADGKLMIQGALSSFWTTIGVHISDLQTEEVEDIHLRGQAVHPQRYNYVTLTPPLTTGQITPPTASIGSCLVIRRKSEIAGVTANGRVFIGGLPTAAIDIGTLTPAYMGQVNTDLVPNIPLALAAGDFGEILDPVVWSYQDPASTHSIVQAVADRYVRYQRRREVGQGI